LNNILLYQRYLCGIKFYHQIPHRNNIKVNVIEIFFFILSFPVISTLNPIPPPYATVGQTLRVVGVWRVGVERNYCNDGGSGCWAGVRGAGRGAGRTDEELNRIINIQLILFFSETLSHEQFLRTVPTTHSPHRNRHFHRPGWRLSLAAGPVVIDVAYCR